MDKLTHPLGKAQDIKSENLNIEIRKIDGLAILFSQKNQTQKLMQTIGFNTDAGKADVCNGLLFLPLAPNQWLVVGSENEIDGLAGKIDVGYLSRQSASKVCLRVSGKMAREFLSRGCMLDLHESIIQPNFCAQTIMAQTGVTIHFVDETPCFDLYIYSGFAASFWHWAVCTAQQFTRVKQTAQQFINKGEQ